MLQNRVKLSLLAKKLFLWLLILLIAKVTFTHAQCPNGLFVCDSNRCLSSHSICDSRSDCQDETDEAGCDCQFVGLMVCPQSRECFSSDQFCDGIADCKDGFDERFSHCYNQNTETTTNTTQMPINLTTQPLNTEIYTLVTEISIENLTDIADHLTENTENIFNSTIGTTAIPINLTLNDESILPNASYYVVPSMTVTKVTSKPTYTYSSIYQTTSTDIPTSVPSYITEKPFTSTTNKVKKETTPYKVTLPDGYKPILDDLYHGTSTVKPLLNCNKNGIADPYYWKSHKYCPCKKNVRGRECDRCVGQTFHISQKNRDGCLPCFCMNTSRKCKESQMRRKKISVRKFYCNNPAVNRTNDLSTSKLEVSCYLPDQFLGDQIVSYGGKIRFYTNDMIMKAPIKIYLMSPTITLEHRIRRRRRAKRRVSAKLVEKRWTVFAKGRRSKMSKRHEFMTALSNITAIEVVAFAKRKPKKYLVLRKIQLDSATPESSAKGILAPEVEVCTCPDGYEGTSCQRCAPRYTKVDVTPTATDGAIFACHKNEIKEQERKIVFILQSGREKNVLSYSFNKEELMQNSEPIKLRLLRNNSITILIPYN